MGGHWYRFVTCPKCGVGIDEPCVSRGGTPQYAAHAARKRLAGKARVQQRKLAALNLLLGIDPVAKLGLAWAYGLHPQPRRLTWFHEKDSEVAHGRAPPLPDIPR